MSTAHRPTWAAAIGGGGLRDGSASAPTHQFSNKDQPGHKKLKYRRTGQDAPSELVGRDFRHGLEPLPVPLEAPSAENVDADTDIEAEDSSSSEEQSPSEHSDDDDDALMRELEKIKMEREEARRLEEQRKQDKMVAANPLLQLGGDTSFAVKRRWTDDAVFKNQAKGVETKARKRFINDTTRSDFHRKFMDKYIK